MSALTVAELIAELECLPSEMEVRIQQPQNNYWSEISGVALTNVEEGRIRVDDERTTCPNKVIDEDDDSYDSRDVILLS